MSSSNGHGTLRPGVTAVIPARNEERSIAEIIDRTRPFCDEVVVVDGNSVDRTAEIARSYGEGVRVVQDNKKGKGDAVRVGADAAQYETVVFLDADGSHDPADIPALVAPIKKDEADLVVGSRGRGGSDELHGDVEKLLRMIGSDIILIGINLRWKQNLTDSQNGFRAIRTNVIRSLNLKENITTIEQEMTMKCLKHGFRVSETPTHEYSRKYGDSSIKLGRVWPRYVTRSSGISSKTPRMQALRPGRVLVLFAILFSAFAIRVYCFHGYWGTDDGEYARLANAMAHGTFCDFVKENYITHFNAPAHLPLRVGLIAPLAMLFRTFGASEIVMLSYPLIVSMLGVALAFLAGWLLFDVHAGLIAAAFWAVVPQDVSLATSFFPDAIASFLASAGVLAILYVRNSTRYRGQQRFAIGLVAGLLFGASWLCKESIAYLAPFCAVLLVIDAVSDTKSAVPLWLGVAIGSAGVFLGEMTVYHFVRGDFLARMHENERSFTQVRSYLFYEGSRFGWPVGGSHIKALFKRLFLDGPAVIFLNPEFLFLPFFALIAIARAVFWRDRAFLVPALWMLTLAGAYNFASCSFASYTPLVLLDRYLHPILLPATVLTAGLLVRLFAATADPRGDIAIREQRFWASVVALLLVVVSMYSVFREVRDSAGLKQIFAIRAVARVVQPTDRIYTDPLTAKALEFFWKFPSSMNVVNFEGMDQDAVKPGSYVLVDTYRLDWLKVNVGMWLTKDYGYHPPSFGRAGGEPSWSTLWRGQYTTLYRVDGPPSADVSRAR